MIEKELANLGLAEKEARVYLTLLEMGLQSVQKLSQKSGINRATTYVILNHLLKHGLVSKMEKDNISFFSPQPPEQLIHVLKKQEVEIQQKVKQLEELLPTLKGIYNTAENKPIVRFFEGKEGLKLIRKEFIEAKEKEILTIYSLDDVIRVFSKAEDEEYGRQRREKKIFSRGIYVSRHGKRKGDELTMTFRISGEKFPITCDMTIYDNKVAIASLREPLSGVIIENKEIAKTLRSVFKLAYLKSKDLQLETPKSQ